MAKVLFRSEDGLEAYADVDWLSQRLADVDPEELARHAVLIDEESRYKLLQRAAALDLDDQRYDDLVTAIEHIHGVDVTPAAS